uniref:retinoic acid-induced protein 3 n=1 Tax=Doryrhamphus excisus TaxID=161450 RepID=UPI0025AE7194|nr:retinoic acid-induced protein 3 [Doryrhamphus excisus]XP_057904227.1 retinoic acid-induced protein 3 [Doryrhamphus excisus]XP_057904228.1 retinoic acid-induced protein 3 [Doryrhamphus excisus]
MSLSVFPKEPKLAFPVLLFYAPLPGLCHSTPEKNTTNYTAKVATGCGAGLNVLYRYLCDRKAAWGIVLEALAASGFLFSLLLLLGLLIWSLWNYISVRHQRSHIGSTVACMSMFLLATAGIFATTFSFIISLSRETCPTRIFLFGVFFSLAFSCLLARCLALLGFAAARGWGEAGMAVGLFIVQVIIASEWLILVLVRDGMPCMYRQEEFVMLQIYVLCLLAISLILSAHFLCRSCFTYSYNYAGATHQQSRQQAVLLFITLSLSAGIWVAWITMLIRGNAQLERRPQWDDPVLALALVANGWVLLMGHGLSQMAFLCRGEAKSKEIPLSFAGWTSPGVDIPDPNSPKEGKENGSFENEAESRRGRRAEPSLQSPYESEFSMTEIDPSKDYSIPRPQTTNFGEPYDDYYGPF